MRGEAGTDQFVGRSAPLLNGLREGIASAISLLTILPLHPRGHELAHGAGREYFPLAGWALGAIAAGVALSLRLVAPLSVAAIAGIATLVICSGALHLDGLADSADGLFGGSTPERRREIMKDSRVGSFGVVAIVLVLAGSVLAAIGDGANLAVALLTAAVLSRSAASLATRVRGAGAGLGALVSGPGSAAALVGTVAVLTLPVAAFGPARAGVAAVAAGAAALLVVLVSVRKIGGMTGDTYGALIACSELAVLVVFACHLPVLR